MFTRFATTVANVTGSAASFLLAAAVVIGWLISGPFFGFSDTWQLVINTGTTIITFLMVFVIQHTQNQQTTALMHDMAKVVEAMGKRAETREISS